MTTKMKPESFECVRRFIRERSSIVLADTQGYLVEMRLSPIAKKWGLGSIDELVLKLSRGHESGLSDEVLDALTTNETSFYRDGDVFAALEASILPEMIEKRANVKSLAIWSAACSSGQELYTTSILLRDAFPVLRTWKIRFFASDISGKMIERARAGKYTQLEIDRGLSPAKIARVFSREGTEYRVRDEYRLHVEFVRMNLAAEWPVLPAMDLIFMRNVLIYFDKETKSSILRRASVLLKPDGYLLLGSSETAFQLCDQLTSIQVGKAVVYQRARRTSSEGPNVGGLVPSSKPSPAGPSGKPNGPASTKPIERLERPRSSGK